jgi:hypothetical protein
VGPTWQREGERERKGAGFPGWLGWTWAPGAAQVGLASSFFIFFLLFSFSFVSDFCFGFLKMLN